MRWAMPSGSSSSRTSSTHLWSQPQVSFRVFEANQQSAAPNTEAGGSNPLGSQHAGSAASSSSSSSSAHNPRETCQLPVLALLHVLHPVLVHCSLSASDSFSTTAADSAADVTNAEGDSAEVRWGYLLPQLQQSSVLAKAAAAFDSKWPNILAVIEAAVANHSSSSSTSETAPEQPAADTAGSVQPADISALYADALQLCRGLVAAAPLPLVCNTQAVTI
jgi:hypothetical protein